MLNWRKKKAVEQEDEGEWTVKAVRVIGHDTMYTITVYNAKGKHVGQTYSYATEGESIKDKALEFLASKRKYHYDQKHPEERTEVFTERDL